MLNEKEGRQRKDKYHMISCVKQKNKTPNTELKDPENRLAAVRGRAWGGWVKWVKGVQQVQMSS